MMVFQKSEGNRSVLPVCYCPRSQQQRHGGETSDDGASETGNPHGKHNRIEDRPPPLLNKIQGNFPALISSAKIAHG
jgi:hypothetical protein